MPGYRDSDTGFDPMGGSKRKLTRTEWALAIANHFGLDANLIDWVTSAELAQPAPRPLRSGLTCARLLAEPDAPRLRGIARGLAEIDWLAN